MGSPPIFGKFHGPILGGRGRRLRHRRGVDIAAPAVADGVYGCRRERHVVQALGQSVAIGMGPLEECQHDLGFRRIGRVLVDENESRAGNGPGIVTGLVRQRDVEARCMRPVGLGGCTGLLRHADEPARSHNAWPIAGATFILVYKHPADPAKTKIVLTFFQWAYANGDALAKSLDSVPLPATTVNAIGNSWRSNIDAAAMP